MGISFGPVQIQSGSELNAEFQQQIDERIAIIEIDGNLSRDEAETLAYQPENVRTIVWSML